MGGAGVHHLGQGVVPQVLLHAGPGTAVGVGVLHHPIEGMAAAHAGGLHAPAGGEVGGAQADPLHPRAGGADGLHIVHPFRRLQQGVQQDRPGDPVLRLQQGQQLVHVVDVPGALHLGDDDHVQLLAHGGDDLGDVVQMPGGVEAVDPGPQAHPGGGEVVGPGHLDEAGPGGGLGLRRDGVLQIADDHVHLLQGLADLGADLVQVRGHEMQHPLHPGGQFAIGRGGADGQGLEESAGGLGHGRPARVTGRLRR